MGWPLSFLLAWDLSFLRTRFSISLRVPLQRFLSCSSVLPWNSQVNSFHFLPCCLIRFSKSKSSGMDHSRCWIPLRRCRKQRSLILLMLQLTNQALLYYRIIAWISSQSLFWSSQQFLISSSTTLGHFFSASMSRVYLRLQICGLVFYRRFDISTQLSPCCLSYIKRWSQDSSHFFFSNFSMFLASSFSNICRQLFHFSHYPLDSDQFYALPICLTLCVRSSAVADQHELVSSGKQYKITGTHVKLSIFIISKINQIISVHQNQRFSAQNQSLLS